MKPTNALPSSPASSSGMSVAGTRPTCWSMSQTVAISSLTMPSTGMTPFSSGSSTDTLPKALPSCGSRSGPQPVPVTSTICSSVHHPPADS